MRARSRPSNVQQYIQCRVFRRAHDDRFVRMNEVSLCRSSGPLDFISIQPPPSRAGLLPSGPPILHV